MPTKDELIEVLTELIKNDKSLSKKDRKTGLKVAKTMTKAELQDAIDGYDLSPESSSSDELEPEPEPKKEPKKKDDTPKPDMILNNESNKKGYDIDPAGKDMKIAINQDQACRIHLIRGSKGTITVESSLNTLKLPHQGRHIIYRQGALSYSEY